MSKLSLFFQAFKKRIIVSGSVALAAGLYAVVPPEFVPVVSLLTETVAPVLSACP